jgi:hypothetical protein
MNNKSEFASRLVKRVLEEIAPDVYNACLVLVQPLITDFKLVPKVIAEIEHIEGSTNHDNIHFVIGVLDRLYIPAQLISKGLVRKPIGLRDAYAEAFGYDNPENINAWVDIMAAYYKNPRFAERVDEVAFKVADVLKTNGELMEKYPEIDPFPQPFEKVTLDGGLIKMVKNRAMAMHQHIEGVESSLLF